MQTARAPFLRHFALARLFFLYFIQKRYVRIETLFVLQHSDKPDGTEWTGRVNSVSSICPVGWLWTPKTNSGSRRNRFRTKAFATFSKDQLQSITFDYLTEAFPFWILGHARPRLRATSFRRIVWNWWALKSLEITSLSMASD